MKRRFLVIIFCISTTYVLSQVGGSSTYRFLTIPACSRVAALGGNNISHYDNDLSFVINNPALLRADMHQKLSMSYINYLGDINLGYVAFANNFAKAGTFAFGLQYFNYGKFIHTNDVGEILGNFHPADYAINASYAHPIAGKFNVGATAKLVVSDYFQYSSVGLLFDAGLSYIDTANMFAAGLTVKNVGVQLKTYVKKHQEPLPFDIQIGMTKRFKHAPIVVSLTAQDLTNWHLRFVSTLDENVQSPDTAESKFTHFMNKVGHAGDELLRHLVLGVEIVPHKCFYIALAYNHRRRMELALPTKPKLVGFSIGFGVKLKKFNISYGLASYHVAAASHHITVGLNIAQMYRKEHRKHLNINALGNKDSLP